MNRNPPRPVLASVAAYILLFMLVSTHAHAQAVARSGSRPMTAEEGRDLQTIDEIYLETYVPIRVLRAQLRTNNLEHQLLALAAIEDQLRTGRVLPSDPTLFDGVAFVLNEGVANIAYSRSTVPYDYHPKARHHAARIMGLIGSEAARIQLVQTVNIDPDPSVRASALYSLGQIGQDPDGRTTQAIAAMMQREHRGTPDPGAVFAALVAIEQIASREGNVVDRAALDMVMEVAVGKPYNRLLRSRAMQVLAVL